jgi:hypothetical protein
MRKSLTEQTAIQKAVALLNDPKVRLVGHRAQLILALLKHEGQRRDLAESRAQRKHEIKVLTLKTTLARLATHTPEDGQASRAAVTAAREFLARVNAQEKGDSR